MLSIEKLHAQYDQPVLRGVDLQVRSGEILALIGPNGAGKSSLIRAVSGVLPSKGRIRWGHLDVADIPSNQRARLMAVVPQAPLLPYAFSVWETVSLGRSPHLNWLGQLGEHDLDKIRWALKKTEIADLAERRIGELSGGEQQRVVLARALAQDCPLLLLDEPTAHLDIHHQISILDTVQRLAQEEGLAVLVAMHDLNLAAAYADRLALLVDGRLNASGTVKEVLTEKHLRAAYDAPIRIESHNGDSPWVRISPHK